MSTEPLVRLENVSRTFNGSSTVALDNVTLSVTRGEFTAIMGASGSGKSTLLNLVAGIDRPNSGTISVNGFDLTTASETDLARYRRQRVGFVFQFFNLLGNLNVIENVMVPAQLAGVGAAEARKRSRALLEQLGIAAIERSYPQGLSGGERQRVAIARALINNPLLVLADEPTGALDSHTGAQVMELLDELNRQAQTILLVTHDVRLATAHGRRVVTLRDGAVVDDAAIEPGHPVRAGELIGIAGGDH